MTETAGALKIAVGSESPRKIDAVVRALRAFSVAAGVSGAPAASDVPETPWDDEIVAGARNRALAARALRPGADLWIGLETGLVRRRDAIYEETWCCVVSADGRESPAYSSGLRVPAFVLARMETLGLPHCDAMTVIERELGLPNDTWGLTRAVSCGARPRLRRLRGTRWLRSCAPKGALSRGRPFCTRFGSAPRSRAARRGASLSG